MASSNVSSAAFERLCQRKTAILEKEGFACSTGTYASPLLAMIKPASYAMMQPLTDVVSQISKLESPYTTLRPPRTSQVLSFSKVQTHGKEHKSIKLEIDDAAEEESSALSSFMPVPQIESTTLVQKGPYSEKKSKFTMPDIDLSDIQSFMMRPLPKGIMLRCLLIRKKELFPRFELMLEKENLFLAGSKRTGGTDYIISTSPSDISKTSTSYIGKLKTPRMGGDYMILTSGRNPVGKGTEMIENPMLFREELGIIHFGNDESGLRGMNVIVPTVTDDGVRFPSRSDSKRGSLEEMREKDGFTMSFISRKPNKDPATNKYQMSFHGRARCPSIKNHQLIIGNNPNLTDREAATLFQLGKMEENRFTCDFTFPFCPFQAFAIALSIFDIR
ncbi:putative tubby protein [Monocercomonoides exilis]|uniref:putative tubby protein n=1 Tax=Monocercomonoides exilis TaxID=2049356 RepID=UPI003559D0EC|nr:putative tubby protein [Monocercomonoides exilis]